MKHSYVLVVFSVVLPLLLVGFVAPMAHANPVPEVFWYDDMEGDVSGWTTEDFSTTAEPRFHVDTYLAYGTVGHSWWCGSSEYDSDGGYGNSWYDKLELPEIDLEPTAVEEMSWGAIKAVYRSESSRDGSRRSRDPEDYPVLTYAYRCDSEIGYDFTYVQVESCGTFVNLAVYDGVTAWTDIGPTGFDLSGYGSTLRIRFRFASDGAYSDEDGLYLSNGGAFHVDNIKVYEYLSGEILFYDDVESGGLCIPSVPWDAGDYWHLIDRECPALSDPHCWWCGDDSDTSHVPPNLNNGLYTPVIDLYESYQCFCHFAMHLAIPTVDNDYISLHATCDGINYYEIVEFWGDFGCCDGWAGSLYNDGIDIAQFCSTPFQYGGMLFVMHTTDNGCGPGGGGDAGVMIDDFWLESNMLTASRGASEHPSGGHTRPPEAARLMHATRYYGR